MAAGLFFSWFQFICFMVNRTRPASLLNPSRFSCQKEPFVIDCWHKIYKSSPTLKFSLLCELFNKTFYPLPSPVLIHPVSRSGIDSGSISLPSSKYIYNIYYSALLTKPSGPKSNQQNLNTLQMKWKMEKGLFGQNLPNHSPGLVSKQWSCSMTINYDFTFGEKESGKQVWRARCGRSYHETISQILNTQKKHTKGKHWRQGAILLQGVVKAVIY